jgi:hypothetical protein
MIKWLAGLADRITQPQNLRLLSRILAWALIVCSIGLFVSMPPGKRGTLRSFWLMTALLLAASLAYVKSLPPNRYLTLARLFISLTAIFAAVMSLQSH